MEKSLKDVLDVTPKPDPGSASSPKPVTRRSKFIDSLFSKLDILVELKPKLNLKKQGLEGLAKSNSKKNADQTVLPVPAKKEIRNPK